MNARFPAVAGVILAGGRATRMGGRDKAFATVGGEPIAVRTVRLLHSLFPQVIVATDRPERFADLAVEPVADRVPGCGPLGGIHAAMIASRHPHVFVTACDMPALDGAAIALLVGRIGTADAIVPCWEDDIEPLHAVYALRALPTIERCLAEGRHALRQALPDLAVDDVPEAALRAVRGGAASLTNVNTPEELAAVGGRFAECEPGVAGRPTAVGRPTGAGDA